MRVTDDGRISGNLALFVVAATSGLVLVVEILAGRLMAPYVGVSLDTFTGIIGTILAGIALGAAVGGALADRYDPVQLIAEALVLGGALTWMSIPIVRFLGPGIGSGPVAIVVLSAASFLLPAAVLSGIGPMVAKLELSSLQDSGAVVGKLSAAGTFGALLGTFGTGFFLIGWFPVRAIIIGAGALLVLGGLAVFVRSGRARPQPTNLAIVLVAGVLSIASGTVCDHTTEYYCVRIVADDPEVRPNGRSLIIDQLRHAHVDLDDPTYLDIRYMRLFADAVTALPDGPIRVLHIGGGGFSLPRYIDAIRPGSTHTVLELDDELVTIAENELGLAPDELDIRTGDARLHLEDLRDSDYDLIVGDAFSGDSVPWHLATLEVVEEVDRLLADDGLYIMNVIDGANSNFARSQLATYGEVFEHLILVEPTDGIADRPVNQVIVAAHSSISNFAIAEDDGRRLSDAELAERIGDDALVLTDDYAPTDQLLP